MRRSADFGATVSRGVRAAQPDLVVHYLRADAPVDDDPKVGLVVSKAVGNAVERHRVARRLRHVARTILDDLERGDRLVIRALPPSRDATSARLGAQLRAALDRARRRVRTAR